MRLLLVFLYLAACSPQMMKTPDSGATCGTTLSPANLVDDPSFECKDGAAWTVVSGTFALVSGGRTGMKAAQLTATATGAGQMGLGPVVASTSGKAYCVNAWVKGTASSARLEVLPTSAGVAQSFSTPVTADWVQAPMSTNLKMQVAAGDSLYLRFTILQGSAGQTLLVDDIDFFESDAGTCMERH